MRAESVSVRIPDNWMPTSENINALPMPLRDYIHGLEARCDPAGDVSRMAMLNDENQQLRAARSRRRPLCKHEGLKATRAGEYCTRITQEDFYHARGQAYTAPPPEEEGPS